MVYGIMSGRLLEVSAPGGWRAKFKAEAFAAVDFDQARLDLSTTDMQVIPKQSLEEIRRRIGLIHDGKPIVLALTLGRGPNYYDQLQLLEALKALGQLRNFKFVLISDADNHAVGYMPSWALRSTLERPDGGGTNFLQAINDGRKAEVAAFPGVITRFVKSNESNVEALKAMEDLNLEAVVVIDSASGIARGVAERDRLLTKLMLKLIPGSDSKSKAA